MTLYDLKFTCPDLRNQADEISIREVLSLSPGIDIVDADHRTHRVHVTTANQDGGANVIKSLTEAGYPPE